MSHRVVATNFVSAHRNQQYIMYNLVVSYQQHGITSGAKTLVQYDMYQQHFTWFCEDMAPKKRSSGGAGGPPSKSKKGSTPDDLQRLADKLLKENPHVGMLERWL